MVSHELKTPLTTIKAYVQIPEGKLENKSNGNLEGIIRKMGSQINRLTSLVKELLDFTRIQQGQLLYNEAFFNLNDLVNEVVEGMQKMSPAHKIKNNPGERGNILGDRDKICQVINNLLANAIKYSPNAHEIVVGTVLQKDGMQLYVKDYGLGIAEHEQQNIFEQFYRVNESNGSTFPGLGIGLFICSQIVARQGGKIWVESSIGKGATFYAWLPFDHSK